MISPQRAQQADDITDDRPLTHPSAARRPPPAAPPHPCRQVMQDDVHLLCASEDRAWSVWDITQEKLCSVQHAPMGAVRGVAMAPDQVGVWRFHGRPAPARPGSPSSDGVCKACDQTFVLVVHTGAPIWALQQCQQAVPTTLTSTTRTHFAAFNTPTLEIISSTHAIAP
jgi:hypothetical protein